MKRKPSARRPRASKKKKSAKKTRKKTSSPVTLIRTLFTLFLIFILYIIYLDFDVRSQFDGRKWSVPARVYARPLELYIGKPLSQEQLKFELMQSGYRLSNGRLRPGEYQSTGKNYRIVTRQFDFWDSHQPPRYIEIEIDDGFITNVLDFRDSTDIAVVRLEPAVIDRIYPSHREDRLLVKIDEMPDYLIDALLAVEDRQFYSHFGINPIAIMRAILANIKAGAVVQGGSTLTQQLVKNFFLTREKSLSRKFNEAIMSLLLEFHYEKNEILEAYINEIYLGQDKKRAIHGFGLASRFYFDKPIYNLSIAEMSTLVALVKGPSYYDPWRHTSRAIQRRNTVLSLMVKRGKITSYQLKKAKSKGIGVVSKAQKITSSYPAYMDLLRRQLQKDYKTSDLNSEGLQIFSTFDPYIQHIAERVVKSQVQKLDKKNNLQGHLQTAVIVTNTSSADVLAVVGDKNPTYAGFNRALDAYRAVGSLIKPAVYLTALANKNKYSLVTVAWLYERVNAVYKGTSPCDFPE